MATTEMNCLSGGGGGISDIEMVYVGTRHGYNGFKGYTASAEASISSSAQAVVFQTDNNTTIDYDLGYGRYVNTSAGGIIISITAKVACDVCIKKVKNYEVLSVETDSISAGNTKTYENTTSGSSGDYLYLIVYVRAK